MKTLANIFPKIVNEYILITLGSVILALSIALFFNPHSLVTGGVSGIAIIIYELSYRWWGESIPLWMTNFAFNVPILAVATKVFGLKVMAKTVYSMLTITGALYLADFLPEFMVDDLLLVSVFGGIAMGIGLSLVFMSKGATGGTSTLATLINLRIRHLSIAKIMLVIDVVIVGIGLMTFDIERMLYAVIAIFICTKVIDSVLEGLNFAKAVLIISERSEEVADNILNNLNRGVTSLSGEGMYSRQPRNVLLCIVSNKEIVDLKDIVRSTDENAFVIVTDAREVLGQGFQVMR